MFRILFDGVVAFVLSFAFIYIAVLVFDIAFVKEKKEKFSFERFFQSIKNKF